MKDEPDFGKCDGGTCGAISETYQPFNTAVVPILPLLLGIFEDRFPASRIFHGHLAYGVAVNAMQSVESRRIRSRAAEVGEFFRDGN